MTNDYVLALEIGILLPFFCYGIAWFTGKGWHDAKFSSMRRAFNKTVIKKETKNEKA